VRIRAAIRIGMVNELVHLLAENLIGTIAEHLRSCWIDNGDAAFEIDTEDAVAHGLQHGV